ncbi:hypothetical protein L3X38_030360 [Prunus dulcis]|uniref:Uncharacterized protein n=1 Tax=Prunus dulcis TaxID=3755 RepID=A0AAD4VB97_PRUDU|nr:hypothetical protein L3X38_030360 [Prunus dulcis]
MANGWKCSKGSFSAGALPGQKTTLGPNLTPAHAIKPGQGMGPTSPGKPTGKIGLGCCPKGLTSAADASADRHQQEEATWSFLDAPIEFILET